jgi:hypothetical protein
MRPLINSWQCNAMDEQQPKKREAGNTVRYAKYHHSKRMPPLAYILIPQESPPYDETR